MPRHVSRRSFFGLIGLAATAACSNAVRPVFTPTLVPPTPSVLPETPPASPAAISIDDKIGQMVMSGFRGLAIGLGDPFAAELQRHLGAAILFDFDIPANSPVRNIQSPQQVGDLTSALQSIASPRLLVAVDQEGGQVVRLNQQFGFPATLSQGELGRRDGLALTSSNAATIASTLADAGINLNLAPVVDLNVNPTNPIIGALDRSYSADPDVVTRHALACIRAHHAAGVLTTLKHFPGHGSSTADSHLGFVDVTNTWSRSELQPFANIINAGEADVIMTAHVFNATLDPDYPATLSRSTVTGILRQQLGFGGVVISDDMQMRAISDRYGFEGALKLAINAGVDIIAIANNTVYEAGVAGRAIDIIRAAVSVGEISTTRIDEAYGRITALKARLG